MKSHYKTQAYIKLRDRIHELEQTLATTRKLGGDTATIEKELRITEGLQRLGSFSFPLAKKA